MNSNPVVLSYHESLLRRSDIQLLKGPSWLNDTLISFYFEYLEIDCFKNSSKLLFVPPDVTQCVKISPLRELDVFLAPLEAKNRDFIFFALNNNEHIESSGGTHWSLLVFSQPERMIYHFDSSIGLNQDQAVELGEKLMNYFGLPSVGRFCEPNCLQQWNGYDCGIYVLCHAEHIASYVLSGRKVGDVPVLSRDTVDRKRQDILNVVDYLKNR